MQEGTACSIAKAFVLPWLDHACSTMPRNTGTCALNAWTELRRPHHAVIFFLFLPRSRVPILGTLMFTFLRNVPLALSFVITESRMEWFKLIARWALPQDFFSRAMATASCFDFLALGCSSAGAASWCPRRRGATAPSGAGTVTSSGSHKESKSTIRSVLGI